MATTKCLANVKVWAPAAVIPLNDNALAECVPPVAFSDKIKLVEFVIDVIVAEVPSTPTPFTDMLTTREVVSPTVTVTTGLRLTVEQVSVTAGTSVEKEKDDPLSIAEMVAIGGIPVPVTPIPTERVAVVPVVTVFAPVTVVKVSEVVLE